ncbi:MAG TPA: peptidylprolyl isomerase [Nitrospinota bacterium]|nr:peptidylprolyl isomerase [Nitrospinota bacterium]
MFRFKSCLTIIIISILFFSDLALSEQKKDDEKVLAVVNGRIITIADMNRVISKMPSELKKNAQKNKSDFLNSLIRRELLYQEGMKKKLDKDPRIRRMIDEYKYELIIQEYLNPKLKEIGPVSDKDAKSYYEKNKAFFQTKEEITASHILLKTEKEAKEVLQELKNGKDFFELAKKRSIDRSTARQGGRLGSFPRGTMVPEFEEVAFNLKSGEMSPIVKTEFGYHIILVTDQTGPQTLDFVQVKNQIKKRIRHQKTQQAINELLDELIKEAKIEINEENLR